MSSYLGVCEHLYSDWLEGKATLRSSAARSIFSDAHAPEPYLMFGQGQSTAIWVTTNPGEGFDYQLRPSATSKSVFDGVKSYEVAAKKLGTLYSSPMASIHPAARANIASMLRISKLLGATRVMQVETYPWHSRQLPNKAKLDVTLSRDEPTFVEYQRQLRAMIDKEPLVLAWCAGVPSRSAGAGIDLKARAIRLDLQRAKVLPLESTTDVSQALFWSADEDRFRGLFVTQGSATLPSAGLNRRGQRKDELIRSVLSL